MIIVKSIFWSHQRSIWCTYMINTSNSPWIIQLSQDNRGCQSWS